MYTLQKSRIIPFIQITMAVIYILFGLLKVFGGSPADDLIMQSVSFFDFEWFYPTLGIAEVFIGLSFLHLGIFRKVGFWLFIGHMAGTFLPFVTTPELCLGVCDTKGFSHPTFTIVGQYIVKNFSLIACGFVLKYSISGEIKE